MRESQMVVIAVNTLDLIIYKIWNTSDEVLSSKNGKNILYKEKMFKEKKWYEIATVSWLHATFIV